MPQSVLGQQKDEQVSMEWQVPPFSSNPKPAHVMHQSRVRKSLTIGQGIGRGRLGPGGGSSIAGLERRTFGLIVRRAVPLGDLDGQLQNDQRGRTPSEIIQIEEGKGGAKLGWN